jgi:CheY-like chemotaxis protein
VDDVSARRVVTGYRGTGCVLVVDDEPAVRAATAAILSSCGYRVVEAEGGEVALRLLGEGSVDVDVVLLDLAMPGINGEQTLCELRKLKPDVPVVLLTAYAEDELRLRAIRSELSGIVSKPFSYEELVKAVKGATGVASSSTPTLSVKVAEGPAYRHAT